MIVPQMQQRWTGYSSEGSGSLLGAVLGARQAGVAERQAGVAERQASVSEENQKLKNKIFKDRINRIDDQNKYRQGLASQNINKNISDEAEANRDRLGKKYVKNMYNPQGWFGYINPYNPNLMDLWFNEEGRKADLREQFDKIAPKQSFEPNQNLIVPDNPNVTVDPYIINQYFNTPQLNRDRALDNAALFNLLGE
tara:strand:+ start:5680 stop:6267 length:588 start_codon:yes stop_codon:yes gene_type:complete